AGPAKTIPIVVLPIADAPVSGEFVMEHIETSPQENSAPRRRLAKFYRDSKGRIRQETTVGEQNDDNTLIVQIFDTDDGFMALLIPQERTAYKVQLPPREPGAAPRWVILGVPSDELMREAGERTFNSEQLGTKTLEGIEFEATLNTITVSGQR